jgi:molybdopterin converting factor small subunit
VAVALRLFAQAREAAGTGASEWPPSTLDELLARARAEYGPEFAAVLGTARVWLNGEEPEAGGATVLADGDEVAILPPVSGG